MRLKISRRSILFLALLAPPLAGAWLGFHKDHQRNDEFYGPGQAVVRYFEAISRKDCGALKQSVTGKLAEEIAATGCEPTFARMRAHQVEYVAGGRARVDGRDEHARLVPIQLRFDNAKKELLVRVSKTSDTWRLATL